MRFCFYLSKQQVGEVKKHRNRLLSPLPHAAHVWSHRAPSAGRAAHSAWHYLAGYSLLSAAQVALQLASQFAAKSASLRASGTMHMGMLSRLLRAPMALFHTTPPGRVVNRLTKDTADADRNLMDFSAFYTRSLMQLTSTVCLIALLNPFSLWALAPVLLAFYFLYAYFQVSAVVLPLSSMALQWVPLRGSRLSLMHAVCGQFVRRKYGRLQPPRCRSLRCCSPP